MEYRVQRGGDTTIEMHSVKVKDISVMSEKNQANSIYNETGGPAMLTSCSESPNNRFSGAIDD